MFKFNVVSVAEVNRELKALKRKKATGCDDLPSCMLKDCANTISKPVTHLINLSLSSGIFPTDWKLAFLNPVFKSGRTDLFENYRPISILPVLSKVLEKKIKKQVMEYLSETYLLSENQFGFRCKRSTELASILFTDSIRKEVDQGKMVGAIFIDLSKAFDTISHAKLLDKLKQYGICNKELMWFTDYLFNRSQQVKYNGATSERNAVFNGVPQGSILGPLLFLIFFNDLPDCLHHSQIMKYADDTVLFISSKDFHVIETKLSEDISHVAK